MRLVTLISIVRWWSEFLSNNKMPVLKFEKVFFLSIHVIYIIYSFFACLQYNISEISGIHIIGIFWPFWKLFMQLSTGLLIC